MCTWPPKARHSRGLKSTPAPKRTESTSRSTPSPARTSSTPNTETSSALPARCRRLWPSWNANESGPPPRVAEHGIHAILSDNCYGCSVLGPFGADVPPAAVADPQMARSPGPCRGEALGAVVRRVVGAGPRTGPRFAERIARGRRRPPPHRAHRSAQPFGQSPRPQRPQTWFKVGMVSGVEPHRSLMEKALRQWMQGTQEPCLIVAGQPGGGVARRRPHHHVVRPVRRRPRVRPSRRAHLGVPKRLQFPTRLGGPSSQRHSDSHAWPARARIPRQALGRSVWVHLPVPTRT